MKKAASHLQGRVFLAVVGVGSTIAAVVVLLSASLSFAVFALFVLALVVMLRRAAILTSVFLIAPFIPLLRRLVNNGTASNADPLAVVAFVAVGLVLAASFTQILRVQRMPKMFAAGALMVAASVVLSLGLGGGAQVEGLFSALGVTVSILLIAAIGAGAVPDVWPSVERYLPLVGALGGLYGLYQYYVLPQWDRFWMLNSGLSSIGQPLPQQVRIFGPAEAPGPFAFVLGLCVVIVASKALSSDSRNRLLFAGLSVGLLIPMLLTGVRTAIVGVVISLAAILFLRSRGASRILPMIGMAVVLALLVVVQGRLSGSSSLFAADRYTGFNASTDKSFQDRIEILSLLKSPSQYLVGHPSGARYDNIVIDLMVNFGLLAAVGVAIALIAVMVAAVSNLREGVSPVAASSSVFILIAALSGNIFLSGFGLIAAAALGSTLRSKLMSRRTPHGINGAVPRGVASLTQPGSSK